MLPDFHSVLESHFQPHIHKWMSSTHAGEHGNDKNSVTFSECLPCHLLLLSTLCALKFPQSLSGYSLFFLDFIFNNLCTQSGSWTDSPEIESHVLCRQSQPGSQSRHSYYYTLLSVSFCHSNAITHPRVLGDLKNIPAHEYSHSVGQLGSDFSGLDSKLWFGSSLPHLFLILFGPFLRVPLPPPNFFFLHCFNQTMPLV